VVQVPTVCSSVICNSWWSCVLRGGPTWWSYLVVQVPTVCSSVVMAGGPVYYGVVLPGGPRSHSVFFSESLTLCVRAAPTHDVITNQPQLIGRLVLHQDHTQLYAAAWCGEFERV